MNMFALRVKSEMRGEHFAFIFRGKLACELCGHEEVVAVTVREPEEGEEPTHWCWEDADAPGEYSLIWMSKIQFEVCFPYGYKAAEKSGKGRMVRVVVKERKVNDEVS